MSNGDLFTIPAALIQIAAVLASGGCLTFLFISLQPTLPFPSLSLALFLFLLTPSPSIDVPVSDSGQGECI